MADTRPGLDLAAERDEERTPDVESQVRRIVASPIFRNSPLLQSFLRFVTDRALHDRQAEISEYTIATQVFARSADFDPAADTIVRTQAYRLRSKLQLYYSTAGAGDPVVIDIPKGHYVPMFRPNDPASEPLGGAPVTVAIPSARPWRRIVLIGATVLGVFSLGLFTGTRNNAPTPARSAKAAPPTPVEAFWLSFLETDRQPIVAFTNGQFLGTETGDLLRFSGGPVADRGALMPNPAGAPKLSPRVYYEDDYTGVGEVLAAVAISNALSPLTGPLPFKRSRLVTAYDLQHHNLIFLGSRTVNPILYDLPQAQNFIFRYPRTPPLLWRSQIENVHPASGELPSYQLERDAATGVLRTDYATITLLPGIAPGRKILIVAGLSTSGTEGAAETVTTLHGVMELAVKLGVVDPHDPEKWPEAFQALLRVELSRGLDVIQSHTVASRVTKWKK